jgi:hypothetical protein
MKIGKELSSVVRARDGKIVLLNVGKYELLCSIAHEVNLVTKKLFFDSHRQLIVIEQ